MIKNRGILFGAAMRGNSRDHALVTSDRAIFAGARNLDQSVGSIALPRHLRSDLIQYPRFVYTSCKYALATHAVTLLNSDVHDLVKLASIFHNQKGLSEVNFSGDFHDECFNVYRFSHHIPAPM